MTHQSAQVELKDSVTLEIANIDAQAGLGKPATTNDLDAGIQKMDALAAQKLAYKESEEGKAIPGKPVLTNDLDHLYTMWCMERPPQVTAKTFRYKGSFRDACLKAKSYCDSMRFRFLYCRPFITDLDQELKVHLGE